MALAAKFDKITIDEVPAIVSAVKSDGVKKSGLADNWEVLQARVGSTDEKAAVAGCKAVIALMEEAPLSQIFVKECLGACKFFLVLFVELIGIFRSFVGLLQGIDGI